MRGDNVGFPALLCAGETEQAYDVAVVCVEILASVDVSSVLAERPRLRVKRMFSFRSEKYYPLFVL